MKKLLIVLLSKIFFQKMRIKYNPNKDQPLSESSFFHQIIIPIYISSNEEFHRDSFKILKICLESLFKTCHSKTFFTCVNNGSKIEVRNYLDGLFDQGIIHEVIHTDNIGKVNSILKGLKGHDFDFVTVTDSDVLFLNGWQEECYEMFTSFKKLGALSTCPNPKLLKFHTWNVISEFLFSRNLRFSKVVDPEGLKQFALSISNFDLFKSCHYEKNLALHLNGKTGVLGAGHFVVTYRKEIFQKLALHSVNYKLGGNSEGFLDELASTTGCWRLATSKSFSLHMGNIEEPWMSDNLEKLFSNQSKIMEVNLPELKESNSLKVFFSNNVLSRILSIDFVFKLFLKFKGLDKKYISSY